MISGIRYQLGYTQVVGDKLFEYQSSRLIFQNLLIHPLVHPS